MAKSIRLVLVRGSSHTSSKYNGSRELSAMHSSAPALSSTVLLDVLLLQDTNLVDLEVRCFFESLFMHI